MPSPCTCDCGLTMDGGQMCLDWSAVAMKRVCAVTGAVAGTFEASPDWALQRDLWLAWKNTTCRTHCVLAQFDVPYVKIKVGGGNTWYVRGYIDAAINQPGPPVDTTREPEMQWSANWYLALPAGTDQEASAPGSAQREYIVQPGDRLVVGFRFFARTANYTAQSANRLEIAPANISLSAWPSNVTTGSGRTC